LFVHAGIDPKKNLSDQLKKDYLWSRSNDFFHKALKLKRL
jgi:hypothetical protein